MNSNNLKVNKQNVAFKIFILFELKLNYRTIYDMKALIIYLTCTQTANIRNTSISLHISWQHNVIFQLMIGRISVM